MEDSYRTTRASFSDRITDAHLRYDALDPATLGFTGFGDANKGTLAVRWNPEARCTCLKSFEAMLWATASKWSSTASWTASCWGSI